MGDAKALRLEPITASTAHRFVKAHHYSGKSNHNAQLCLGCFLSDALVGVLTFGPPMDRRKVLPLVQDTPWNGVIELQRFVLLPWVARNSESRAIAVACRILARRYSDLEWVLSYADATQCGDGTIYRAAGFLLTGIRENSTIYKSPTGETIANLTVNSNPIRYNGTGKASMRGFVERGWRKAAGFQLRYIRCLRPGVRERLTVPILPYSAIAEAGAGMYLGRPKDSSEPPAHHAGEGGAAPTRTLHTSR